MVLGVLVYVVQGLLEVSPPGAGEEMVQGLVYRDFVAVRISHFPIEVHVGEPQT